MRDQQVARALTDVCRGGEPRVPAGSAFADALVRAARHHRVAPLAHVRLRPGHPALAARLAEDRDHALAHHVRTAMVLGELNRVLGDIPWVTFKGPVLSETAHPVAGLRAYRDLDVLVAPSSLRAAASRLRGAGWAVADLSDMLRNPETPGEMHWLSPAGILVDLHWSMVNMASRRRLVAVPTQELLERRVRVRVGLHDVWTLDPADTLVHVALHAALTGGNKLVWLLDVDQLVRRKPDWPEVARRARDWRAAPHLALMLRRSARVLGTPCPPGLDRMLGTSVAFRAVADVTDVLSPVPRLTREASLARLVARAARPGAVRTVGAAARGVARNVGGRLRPSGADGPVRAPADHAALAAYLDAVEVGDRVERAPR